MADTKIIESLLRECVDALKNNPGGSAEGFNAGSEADRLALTPENGWEFNQIDENGKVTKYLYENDEWVIPQTIEKGISYIVEYSNDPAVPIDADSDLTTVDKILNCEVSGNPGSYVIDEVHKKYARLDPEDHSKFADGTTWSGTYGNAFRHIDRMYLLKNDNYIGTGTKYTIFTDDPLKRAVEYKESWIGVYLGAEVSGKLVSRPGLTPKREQTIEQLQALASSTESTGKKYGIFDYHDWYKLCHLFMAKYGTRDSQDTIGMGMTKDPAETDATHKATLWGTQTGYTESLGDGSGECAATTVNGYAYKQCKLFGIEALWGQNWQFLKGIRFNGATAYVLNANAITSSTPSYRTFTRPTSLSANPHFNVKMVLGKYGDMIVHSTPGTSGTSATGYCDATWVSSGENILLVGGHSTYGFSAGIFASSSYNVFSNSAASSGSRICFYGDISDYELVTGAELEEANS